MKSFIRGLLIPLSLFIAAVLSPVCGTAANQWHFVSSTTPVYSAPTKQSEPITDIAATCYLYLSKGMMVLGEAEDGGWISVMFRFPGMTGNYFTGYIPASCVASQDRLGKIDSGTYVFRNPKLDGMTLTVGGERGSRTVDTWHPNVGSDVQNYKIVAPDDNYLYVQYYNPTWKSYHVLFSLVRLDNKYYLISYDYDDLYNDPAADLGFYMPADNR